MKAKIRKLIAFVEETRTEMSQAVDPPTRRAAAAAVIENPFAARYVEDLTESRARRRTRAHRAFVRAGEILNSLSAF
jgi:hypothetical protein